MPPGDYKIEFESYDYVTEWYKNKYDYSLAEWVTVSADSPLSGIDAQLGKGGQITGTVTDTEGNPISSNVSVTAWDDISRRGYNGYVDENGEYTIDNLHPGDYRVQFDVYEGGYASETYNNAFDECTATNVSVFDGQITNGIDAQLAKGVTISGTVLNFSTNEPIQNLNVQIFDAVNAENAWNYIEYANTEADGKYTITGLPDGVYKIKFARPYSGGYESYIDQWYNIAQNYCTADEIAAGPGKKLTIDWDFGKGGNISGLLTDMAGTVLSGCRVEIFFETVSVGYTTTDDTGKYQFFGLAQGDYRIRFSKSGYKTEWYPDATAFDAAQAITVALNASIPDINGQLASSGPSGDEKFGISGKVTDDRNLPLQNVHVSVRKVGGGYRYANTDTNGEYRITGLSPGDYDLDFDQYNDPYLIDSQDNALVLTEEEPMGRMDVQLQKGGIISGTVTNLDGNKIEDYRIALYDFDQKELSYNITYSMCERKYSMEGIPAGTYFAKFYVGDENAIYSWYDEQTDIIGATPVTVSAGQTTGGIDGIITKGGGIAGILTNASGTPIVSSMSLSVFNSENKYVTSTWVDETSCGYFEIWGLATGQYKIRFSPTYQTAYYHPHAATFEEAAPISVTLGELTQLSSDKSPPTVTLDDAADVTDTSALLTGTISANGAETSYYFEYGPGDAYESMTAIKTLNAATIQKIVSAPITGLIPNTFYHFRLVAENSEGHIETDRRELQTLPRRAQLRLSLGSLSLPLNGRKEVLVMSGNPPYTVNANGITGSLTQTLEGEAANRIILIGESEGEVRVTVADQFGQSVTLFVSVTPDRLIITPPSLELNVGQTTEIRVSGGTGAYFHELAAGNGEIGQYGPGAFLYTAPPQQGAAVIAFSDGDGRSETVPVTITPAPVLTLTPSEIKLYAGDFFNVNAIAGIKPYTFKTDQGDLIACEDSAVIVNLYERGNFQVSVTDAEGAIATTRVTVLNNILLNPEILHVAPNEQAMLSVTGGVGDYRFAVESGEIEHVSQGRAIYTSPKRTGTYRLNVKDGLENTASGLIVVGDIPKITPSYAYIGRMEIFEFTLSGGFPPYTIETEAGTWTPMESGRFAYTSPDTDGTFQVTAYDTKGATTQLIVDVGGSEIELTPTELDLKSGENVTVEIAGGTPPYKVGAEIGNVSWTGQGLFRYEAPINSAVRGIFSIIVEDAVGRKKTLMVDLNKMDGSCASMDENLNIDLPCLNLDGKSVAAMLMFHPADEIYWTMGTFEVVMANDYPAILDADSYLIIPCLTFNNQSYLLELTPLSTPEGETGWKPGSIQPW